MSFRCMNRFKSTIRQPQLQLKEQFSHLSLLRQIYQKEVRQQPLNQIRTVLPPSNRLQLNKNL